MMHLNGMSQQELSQVEIIHLLEHHKHTVNHTCFLQIKQHLRPFRATLLANIAIEQGTAVTSVAARPTTILLMRTKLSCGS